MDLTLHRQSASTLALGQRLHQTDRYDAGTSTWSAPSAFLRRPGSSDLLSSVPTSHTRWRAFVSALLGGPFGFWLLVHPVNWPAVRAGPPVCGPRLAPL